VLASSIAVLLSIQFGIDTTLRTAAVTYFLTGAVGLFLHAANAIGVVKPVSPDPGATKA